MKSTIRTLFLLSALLFSACEKDDSIFTGPPQLEWLPYKDKTVFQTVGVKTNGSRTFKQGIEFSLSTRRIRGLATKLIVSGAYFKTRYENSEPQYVLTTVQLAEGTPYPYIGLYDQDDNTFHEVCNTNFLLDTQIPKLGLIFSTSFQCQWFSGMKAEWCNPKYATPISCSTPRFPNWG